MGNPKGVTRDFDQLEQRRLRAVRFFDQGVWPAEVARRLGVHRQSASRWHRAWQHDGRRALRKAGRAGRKPRLSTTQGQTLETMLKEGPQSHGFATALWTTQRVAKLIEQRLGVHYHPDHVYRILQRLGWSCQRPTRRARQRDEAAIRRWKKVTWPALKKRRASKAAGSFFWMKAG